MKSYITGLNPQPLGGISSSNNGLMYNYFRSEAATDPCSVSKVIVNKAVKAKKKKVIKRVYPSQLLFIKKPVKVISLINSLLKIAKKCKNGFLTD